MQSRATGRKFFMVNRFIPAYSSQSVFCHFDLLGLSLIIVITRFANHNLASTQCFSGINSMNVVYCKKNNVIERINIIKSACPTVAEASLHERPREPVTMALKLGMS